MTTEILRVTDDSTRAELTEAIAHLRAKQRRMPEHFVDKRQAIADEVDRLVERVVLLDLEHG